MNPLYTLADLEAAINYWRQLSPSSGDELALCPQAAALAEPYARLIMEHLPAIAADQLKPPAREALQAWRQARGG